MRTKWKALHVMLLCGVLILGTIGLAVGLTLDKKEEPIQSEINNIEKISPELATLLNNTSGGLPLVVFIREPPGVKSVDELIPYDKINTLSKLGRSVKEKLESIEKGEKVDQNQLEKEKVILKVEEENLTLEINNIRQKVIENNKKILRPAVEEVATKLQNITGVKIVNKEELVPVIVIIANVESIDSIKIIPEVVRITLDTSGDSDLDISIPTVKANSVWGY